MTHDHTLLTLDNDDIERAAVKFLRQWNKLPVEAREYAFAAIREAAADGFSEVDEDRAI